MGRMPTMDKRSKYYFTKKTDSMNKYVIGLDYGTDSVRAIIVNAKNGEEVGSGVSYYKRWSHNFYCDKVNNQFRQHPLDYIESLEKAVGKAIEEAGKEIAHCIVAISVDTTGSTPVAVNKEGVPLALTPEFKENPNAMFILWKDHTALKEADEINNLAATWGGVDFTKYEGGIYSSEWFWAKILHMLRVDPSLRNAAYSWVEHCDWIPALLCGTKNLDQIKRSRCAAGHKAMWHPEWDGLPSEEFLVKLDPLLAGLRERLYTETYTSDQVFGTISSEWSDRLGLPSDVAIGVGAFDAHLGAVGAQIKPFYLSKVMGTSTCDMVVAPTAAVSQKCVKGICGQVDGSIIPGMMGLEAGQSGFGDVYAWFRDVLMWPVKHIIPNINGVAPEQAQEITDIVSDSILAELSKAAESINPEETGVVALDWFNGRRTPDANHNLKGVIAGLNLGTNSPAIFRALVEATAFGSKRIVERFKEEGIPIEGVIALGGISKKSPFVMQIVTDILNMPILVAKNDQTCALGSAMAASVVAGVHQTFEEAQELMGNGYEKEYTPRPEYVDMYQRLYEKYQQLGHNIEKMY